MAICREILPCAVSMPLPAPGGTPLLAGPPLLPVRRLAPGIPITTDEFRPTPFNLENLQDGHQPPLLFAKRWRQAWLEIGE